jgi:FKBP-type peptidyl-prolyl cis-trans isomerase
MLLDRTEFDSSRRHGGANSFRVDEAIPGLQDVLQYMEEGAKWEVYIPSELAFKEPAAFGGQTVLFELELISIENARVLEPGATRFD